MLASSIAMMLLVSSKVFVFSIKHTRTGMSMVYVKLVERPSYDDHFARHVPGILESWLAGEAAAGRLVPELFGSGNLSNLLSTGLVGKVIVWIKQIQI